MKNDKPIKSADRVLDILELLASTGRSMSHGEIARRTGIPKGSLTPLLRNLFHRSYIEQGHDALNFKLGESTYILAQRGAHSRDLVHASKKSLQELVRVSGESAGLNVLRNDMAERIATVRSGNAMLYSMHPGVLQPLYASSSGKVFLAWMPVVEREAYLSRIRLESFTKSTIKSKVELRRQVERVRNERMATSLGEFTSGVAGVSVPVLDSHGRALATVGVVLPLANLDERRLNQLVDTLHAAARQIARAALP